jgi:integrase
MGRPQKGWSIRIRPGRDAELRFTHAGRQQTIRLRTRDRGEAERQAPKEYAAFIELAARSPDNDPRVLIAESQRPFVEVGAQWLESIKPTIRAVTVRTYEQYLVTIGRHFDCLESFDEQSLERFIAARLSSVQRQTLKHELSSIGRILHYAFRNGWMRSEVKVPRMPPRAKGKRYGKRRVKADAHSDADILALIAALPEWSRRSRKTGKRHPIRARFVFAYEIPLRPATLDLLSVPTHWSPGRQSVWIPNEDDKSSQGREVALTPVALAALESCAPKEGVIFGAHDYRDPIRAAAKLVLPAFKAERFCGQHFRSAGGTHLLDVTRNNLRGVAFVLGHTQITTTARYMRTDERAGAEVIELSGRSRSA